MQDNKPESVQHLNQLISTNHPSKETSMKLEEIKDKRTQAQRKLIQMHKELKLASRALTEVEARYDDVARDYYKLDREYAMFLHKANQDKILASKTQAKSTPTTKQIAIKALKALESLPKELRDQVMADAKERLF